MSTLPAQQPILAEVVAGAPAETASPLRGAKALHASLWLASLAVLVAASLLQVRSAQTVVIPVINRPLPELCYWRVMLGINCPGCGLTRCFISAAHGDVAAAWQFNPLGVFLFAGVVFQVPYQLWQLWRLTTGRREFRSISLPYVMLGVSVLLIVQWLCRVMW